MDSTPTQPPSNEPPVSWRPAPPSSAPPRRGFDLSDFLTFRYLITPGFITAIYVIGAVLITLGTLVSISSSGVIPALIGLVILNLWWRIVLEFVMVLFRINDSLASIDRRGGGGM
ncbi:MAG: DUF4282 domain-containing protein [Chloroflexota bacterium]